MGLVKKLLLVLFGLVVFVVSGAILTGTQASGPGNVQGASDDVIMEAFTIAVLAVLVVLACWSAFLRHRHH